MKFVDGRPCPSFDKRDALRDFLVDLHTAKLPTKLTLGLFDKLLAALDIDMSPDDRDNFVFWVKQDCTQVKEKIARYEELDRRDAVFLENERRAKIRRENEWKQSVWSKIPIWIYVILVPAIIGLVSGLVSR